MNGEAARQIRPTRTIDAEIHVPPSKSYTNRALIAAALAEGTSTLIRPSLSTDSMLLVDALGKFGIEISNKKESFEIRGTNGIVRAPEEKILAGNAGTTIRFLSMFAGMAQGATVLDGDERMRRRPIGALLTAMESAGIHSTSNNGFPPVKIYGGNYVGGKIEVGASVSSQFASAILLTAPYARSPVELRLTGSISSLPYIDMSLHVMRSFGSQVDVVDRHNYRVSNSHKYVGQTFHIEHDATAASYFLAAAALTQGRVLIPNLTLESVQGDLKFLDVLSGMGCTVMTSRNGVELHGSRLHGIDIDMNAMPDCVPTLAVLALFAQGRTRISNVLHLRYKETDRLAVLSAEIRKLGGKVELLEDGLIIDPQPLHGAMIETHNDHRIAMSFALAGLNIDGVAINNPSCVSKSFPDFWKEFAKLENQE